MNREGADAFENIEGRRPTLAERGVRTSQRVKGPADWENTRQFDSIKANEAEWVALFDRRPDVYHQLLGDLYIAVKYDDKKRETGLRLDGRRVMPKDANLPELWDMITPKYSLEPFPAALRELIGDRSMRAFAAKVPMDHQQLSRYARGVRHPSIYEMEKIAQAARVTPAFFLEWRVEFVTRRLTRVMEQLPNLSIGMLKRLETPGTQMRTLVGRLQP